MRLVVPTILAMMTAACGSDDQKAMFPTNYTYSYVQVRACRASADHDLNHVRVLADPLAMDAYRSRDRPFPAHSVILKEEYDFSDDACSGPIKQWTVMARLPSGTPSSTLDWAWQRVDAEGAVVGSDEPRCYGCHQVCGVSPDGYLGTCAVP